MKLSISDISSESYKGSIFVLNTTRGDERGPVVFNCYKLNGRGVDTVTIPCTFLPTNLINYVTKEQILESSDFKNAIRRGFLCIIDEKEAEELESQPGAQEERIRVQNEEAEKINISRSLLGENSDIQPPQSQASQNKSGINPKVEAILSNHSDNGNVATLNSLRNISPDLSIRDLRYIRDFAKQNRIKNVFLYARDLIKARKKS